MGKLVKASKPLGTDGFTLVELAIVLLVVGLMLAAITVAQELVHSAKIRNTATAYNRYVTASAAFQAKYRHLAGDIQPQKAEAFGLTSGPCNLTGFPGTGYTNSDGCNPATYPTTGDGRITRLSSESANFFQHLSMAGLIEGSYRASGFMTSSDQSRTYAMSPLGTIFFPDNFKIGEDGNHTSGKDSFLIGVDLTPLGDPINGFYATGGSVAAALNKISPYEAFGIDSKIDDGHPYFGKMFVAAGYDVTQYGGAPGNFIVFHSPVPVAAGLFSPNCCDSPYGNCQSSDAIYNVADEEKLCTAALQWGS